MEYIIGMFHGLNQKYKMDIYPQYIQACKEALNSEKFFIKFRKNAAYHSVIEGVPGYLGQEYIDYIIVNYPHLLSYMDKFVITDNIGTPAKYNYNGMRYPISSVTSRYIKILGDLLFYFSPLEDLDIVEIGAGFGGQCKIMYDFVVPRSYTIIDLPEAWQLAEKYLSRFGIHEVKFKSPVDILDEKYSLCISNYGFSEFGREYQDLYAEKVIKNSDKGYMICNFFGEYTVKDRIGGFTKNEIKGLKPTGKILPEKPLSLKGNFLYLWKS